MDPITGVVALTGLTVAALAGIRLKKQMNEGFDVLPGEDDNYKENVTEAQTKYNPLMSMVNPVMNPILPVDATDPQIDEKQTLIDEALGGLLTP